MVWYWYCDVIFTYCCWRKSDLHYWITAVNIDFLQPGIHGLTRKKNDYTRADTFEKYLTRLGIWYMVIILIYASCISFYFLFPVPQNTNIYRRIMLYLIYQLCHGYRKSYPCLFDLCFMACVLFTIHCDPMTPSGNIDLRSTLVQVMAYCLTTPSHYPNQMSTYGQRCSVVISSDQFQCTWN